MRKPRVLHCGPAGMPVVVHRHTRVVHTYYYTEVPTACTTAHTRRSTYTVHVVFAPEDRSRARRSINQPADAHTVIFILLYSRGIIRTCIPRASRNRTSPCPVRLTAAAAAACSWPNLAATASPCPCLARGTGFWTFTNCSPSPVRPTTRRGGESTGAPGGSSCCTGRCGRAVCTGIIR